MNEKELMDTVLGDYEPILPDGWKDGDVLIPEDVNDEATFVADAPKGPESLMEENEDRTSDAAARTKTEGDEEGHSADAGLDEATETTLDGAGTSETEPKKESRILKLRVNHRDEEVDVNAMSDEDLIAMMQKSRDYDRRVEADNKRRFREVYQEQLDAGNSDAVARLVAKDATGGKTYALTDEEESAMESPSEPTGNTAPARDLKAEFEQLRVLYPDLKTIPKEVADAAMRGASLMNAYLAYKTRESDKTAASLKKENAVLKQNAASAAKAPVRGVTGGGDTHTKKDSFEEGFDSVTW